MSLSIGNTCSIFNFINELLEEQVLSTFEIRFCIFSGLIQKPEYAQKYSNQLHGRLHKIQNLFEISDKCGFYKPENNPENLSNLCLMQTFNRFYHFIHNIRQLENLLNEEFHNVVKEDLKIGEEESESDQGSDSFEMIEMTQQKKKMSET